MPTSDDRDRPLTPEQQADLDLDRELAAKDELGEALGARPFHEPEEPEEEAEEDAPSTAVATREDVLGSMKAALAEAKERGKTRANVLAHQRSVNATVGEIRRKGWGKSLELKTIQALAQWGQLHDVDVATEVDVLGDRIYLNAQFYFRVAHPLVQDGTIRGINFDCISPKDERLLQLVAEANPWAMEEQARRLRACIEEDVPAWALHVWRCEVLMKDAEKPIVGCDWCGGDTRRTGRGQLLDPVGEEFPVETAKTRAARKALRFVAGLRPQLREQIDRLEAAAHEVELLAAGDRARLKLQAGEKVEAHPVARPSEGYGSANAS